MDAEFSEEKSTGGNTTINKNDALQDQEATCESCGKSGPRNTFHSTTKRFCSPTCSHSYSARHRQKVQKKKKTSNRLILPSEMDRQQLLAQGFDWGGYLNETNSIAAPVNLFSHAPMGIYWGDIGPGVKVEVSNLDCPLQNVYWIAQVVEVAGYKARLRYEGFDDDDGSHDFWCNLCTLDIHSVGWCAAIGKPLVPPNTVQDKFANWRSYLVKRLTGAKTLPADFQERVAESIQSQFKTNHRLELIDKEHIGQMRVGVIEEVLGNRLRVRYEDSPLDSLDHFWCHAQSSLLHPVGWSEKVGHKIFNVEKENRIGNATKNCKNEIFKPCKSSKSSSSFKVGYKLETIDPLNLSAICPATVTKVLKNGYFMIGIDGSEAAKGSDWFCCHSTSPSIFPAGFCEENDVRLTPPKGYDEAMFSWDTYLKDNGCQAVPSEAFNNEYSNPGFEVGMKIECVDLMEPRLVCVATIKRVIHRLLQVHFDGWEGDYDQWIYTNSPDIYPIGWCELVGYDLQPPADFQPVMQEEVPKKKAKGISFLTKKKKKRASNKVKPAATENELPIKDVEMNTVNGNTDNAHADAPY